MLLGEDGKHLCLDSFHLVIELLEVCHLALIPMHLSLQQVIAHFDQCCVDVKGLMPGRQDLTEIVVAVVLSAVIIVPGSCVNFPPLHWSLQCELSQCVRVGSHVDQDILGRDLPSLVIGDGEGDVRGALIELKEVRDGRRTAARLYSNRVRLPRVVESNRAFFCMSHTSLTSSASSSTSSM